MSRRLLKPLPAPESPGGGRRSVISALFLRLLFLRSLFLSLLRVYLRLHGVHRRALQRPPPLFRSAPSRPRALALQALPCLGRECLPGWRSAASLIRGLPGAREGEVMSPGISTLPMGGDARRSRGSCSENFLSSAPLVVKRFLWAFLCCLLPMAVVCHGAGRGVFNLRP